MKAIISKDNEEYSRTIVIHLYLTYCKNMLVSTSSILEQYNDLFNSILILIFIFLYGRLVIKYHLVNKIFRPKTLIIIFLLVVYFLLTWWMKSDLFQIEIVNYDFRLFIAYCFPLFLLTGALDDVDILKEMLFKNSWILFCCATISFILFMTAPKTLTDYSMSYGYAVMPFTIVQMFNNREKKKKLYVLEIVLSAAYIIVAGSRGPIVCILASAIVVFVFLDRPNWKKVMYTIAAMIPTAYLLMNFHSLISFAVSHLESMGISPRTLYLIQTGRGIYDSGRNDIHAEIIENLNNSPILGLGALGAERTVGQAHGLYWDILANFGYIFGSLLIIILGIVLINCLKNNHGTSNGIILLLFSIMCFPKGFFASGFWIDKELWMIIGLLISRAIVRKPFTSKNNKKLNRSERGYEI